MRLWMGSISSFANPSLGFLAAHSSLYWRGIPGTHEPATGHLHDNHTRMQPPLSTTEPSHAEDDSSADPSA
jgi:hypothetical protein